MPCPPRGTFEALLAGRLPGDAQAAATLHLVGCASCRELCAALPRAAADATTRDAHPALDEGPSTAAIVPGQRIGRYVVLWELGRGGMGAVYAAFDQQLDRKVALKLLLPTAPRDASGSGSKAEARLLREAQALARISHPNAVAVFDVGTHRGQVFLSMEHLDGQTLQAWLKAERRSWPEVVRVLSQAGQGLAAAHAAGLVHRDFKPANVIVTREGHVKVLDFGLARLATDDGGEPGAALPTSPAGGRLGEALTEVGSLCGTPGYLAPELLRGLPPTVASDQFAFGVSLYLSLYGQRPFGRAASPRDVALIEAGLPALPPGAPRVPPWLQGVVARCLAARPDDRFPSMPAVLAALAADPARRRARWARRGAGVLLGAAAVLGTWWAGQPPRCPSADELRASVLPPAIHAALEARLTAGHGAAPLAVVERVVAAWSRDSALACAARRAEATPATQLRVDCLARRGATLTAALEALGELEVGRAISAPEAEGALAGGNACEAPGGLGSRTSDDVPEALRPLARQLRSQLIKAQVLSQFEQDTQSLALAQDVVARARDAGLWGFEGEGLYRLAVEQSAFGRDAEGLAAQQASVERLLAAGVDDEALWSAARWARVLARVPSRAEEARVVLGLGEALALRMGNPPAVERTLFGARSAVAGALDDQDAGVRLAEQMLDRLTADGGSEYEAEARGRLAEALWAAGRWRESNEEDVRALCLWRTVLGADHPRLVDRYLSPAMGLRQVGLRAEARAVLDEGRALSRRVSATPNANTVDLDLEAGLLDVDEHPDRALPLIEQALAFYSAGEAPVRRRVALAARAQVRSNQGAWELALADCRALEDVVSTEGAAEGEAVRLRARCEAPILLSRGDVAAALVRFQRAPPEADDPPELAGHTYQAWALALRRARQPEAAVRAMAQRAQAAYGEGPGFVDERAALARLLSATPAGADGGPGR